MVGECRNALRDEHRDSFIFLDSAHNRITGIGMSHLAKAKFLKLKWLFLGIPEDIKGGTSSRTGQLNGLFAYNVLLKVVPSVLKNKQRKV